MFLLSPVQRSAIIMTALQNAGVNSPHYRKLTKYLFDLKLDMAKFHVAKEQLNKVKSNTKIKKL